MNAGKWKMNAGNLAFTGQYSLALLFFDSSTDIEE
jgi:hypothetical protein